MQPATSGAQPWHPIDVQSLNIEELLNLRLRDEFADLHEQPMKNKRLNLDRLTPSALENLRVYVSGKTNGNTENDYDIDYYQKYFPLKNNLDLLDLKEVRKQARKLKKE